MTESVRLSHLGRAVLLLSAGPLLSGCGPSQPERTEESYSSGRITVVTARAAEPVIAREAEAFRALYPQAHIEVRTRTSREAVRALYAAEADLAVVTRELLPDERQAAVQGRLALEGFRFARDGLALVVHPNQPVENLSLDEVRRIFRGEVESWSLFGGARLGIVPVVQPPQSDATDFFADAVMREEPIRAPSVTQKDDSMVVSYIRRTPGALGYVSLRWARRGVKALRLSALRGLDYVLPDLQRVHDGVYPLYRNYSLYVRPEGSALAHGFVTFVTSRDGQELVLEAGLVPTTIPVRFVRRSPMRPLHQTP